MKRFSKGFGALIGGAAGAFIASVWVHYDPSIGATLQSSVVTLCSLIGVLVFPENDPKKV